jgi:hypothetical protein
MKRVYKILDSTTAIPTPYAQDESGNVVSVPVKNPKPVNLSTVKKYNYPTVQDMKPVAGNNPGLISVPGGAPLVPGETNSGKPTVSRVESPDLSGMEQSVISISFDNSAAGAVDETIVIGDGIGLIGDNLNITPPAATLAVNGNYGTDSLLTLKDFARTAPLDFHTLHITADATSFFTNGFIKKAIAASDNSSVNQKQVFFNMLVTGDTFNDLIRVDRNFRFQISPLSGIVVKIPAGRTIELAFYLNAVNDSRLMNLQ